MGRKILLVSLVLIVVGLLLLVFSDPVFRTISGASTFGGGTGFAGGSTIFQECRTVTNESVQQCLTQNGFTGFGGFGGGNTTGVGSSAFAFNTGSVIEGVSGIGLIGLGSVLILVQISRMPSASGKKWRKYRQ